MIILVLGGARSGKSRFAQELALALAKNPVYLATARIRDDEFRARVERHRADRGPEWTTIEQYRLPSSEPLRGRVVVVDCVTLWLTNVFSDSDGSVERTLELATEELYRTLSMPATWILVSNEIGQGVHAMTEAGRRFTDLQGFMNQRIAARADAVALMVAGIPVAVKGALPMLVAHTRGVPSDD